MIDAEQVTSVFLFIISVVFTIGRIAIRRHYKRSLAVDDAFLVFAVLCLTVALVLLFHFISSLYLLEALLTGSPSVIIPSDIFEQIARLHKLEMTFTVLSYTAIFAVKFSFLFLFKALIHNVCKMTIYWWVVVLTTAAGWAFIIVELFLECPVSGRESRKLRVVLQILGTLLIQIKKNVGKPLNSPKSSAGPSQLTSKTF